MSSDTKGKKAVAIVKAHAKEDRTLDLYDFYMSLSENTLDLCMNDLGISYKEIIPQLDLTMELELLRNHND